MSIFKGREIQLIESENDTSDLGPRDTWVSLHEAVEEGNTRLVQAHLEHGTDTEALNASDETPLLVASSKGYKEIVRLLLDKGANVHARNYFGHTAVYCAYVNGHAEVESMLKKEITLCKGHSPVTVMLSTPSLWDGALAAWSSSFRPLGSDN